MKLSEQHGKLVDTFADKSPQSSFTIEQLQLATKKIAQLEAELEDERNLIVHDAANTLLAYPEKAFRTAQVRKKIYVGIAKEMRKAARSYHMLVDRCAGAKHKRGGIVECIAGSCACTSGMYFKFTWEDAKALFDTLKEAEDARSSE